LDKTLTEKSPGGIGVAPGHKYFGEPSRIRVSSEADGFGLVGGNTPTVGRFQSATTLYPVSLPARDRCGICRHYEVGVLTDRYRQIKCWL